jgi:hypothetical protein
VTVLLARAQRSMALLVHSRGEGVGRQQGEERVARLAMEGATTSKSTGGVPLGHRGCVVGPRHRNYMGRATWTVATRLPQH